jgi:hypothetical protein
MADEHSLAPIDFTFAYQRHGWATAHISDGVSEYAMVPSYVPTDPMFELIHALIDVLRYGGEAHCAWYYEPATDLWILRRDGDWLHVTVLRTRAISPFPLPNARGEVEFSTTCDLWQFAAKVRLAASRLPDLTREQDNYRPALVREDAEYRALCEFLEEHKRAKRHS